MVCLLKHVSRRASSRRGRSNLKAKIRQGAEYKKELAIQKQQLESEGKIVKVEDKNLFYWDVPDIIREKQLISEYKQDVISGDKSLSNVSKALESRGLNVEMTAEGLSITESVEEKPVKRRKRKEGKSQHSKAKKRLAEKLYEKGYQPEWGYGLVDDRPVPEKFKGKNLYELSKVEGGTEWVLNLPKSQRHKLEKEFMSDKPYEVQLIGTEHSYRAFQGDELEKFKEEKFSKLPAHERVAHSIATGFVKTGYGIVTFPEFLIEEAGGRLFTGKSQNVLPFREYVGEMFEKVDIGQPPGLVEGGLGRAFGEEKGWKRIERNPIESIFATVGEIGAMWAVGKGVQAGKTAIVRGADYIGLPVEKISSYSPSNLVRKGYWGLKRKLGKADYISPDDVWDAAVLAGEKKFAEESSVTGMVKAFEKSRGALSQTDDIIGIHATPHRFGGILRKTTKVGAGSSESPGLSISAYGRGSPHFLKISAQSKSYYSKTSLLPKLKRPTAPLIRIKKLYRLPKNLRGKSYDVTGKSLLAQKRGSYATIAPKAEIGGPEIEAIITADTKLLRNAASKYTSFKGHVVALPEEIIVDGGLPKGFVEVAKASSKGKAVKEFLSISSATGESSSAIISPSNILSSVVSSKSSKSSSSVMNVKSSVVSSKSSKKSVRSVLSNPSGSSSKKSSRSSISYPSSPSSVSIPSALSSPPSRKQIFYEERKKKKRLPVKKNVMVLDEGARFRIHPVELARFEGVDIDL